jgi:hypothetical protein
VHGTGTCPGTVSVGFQNETSGWMPGFDVGFACLQDDYVEVRTGSCPALDRGGLCTFSSPVTCNGMIMVGTLVGGTDNQVYVGGVYFCDGWTSRYGYSASQFLSY